jgi:hypothetical protein
MLIDVTNYQFWLLGMLWFTAPILSWLWSLVTIKKLKNLNRILPNINKELANIRAMQSALEAERAEVRELRRLAEGELKAASDYYVKIKHLLENNSGKQ